MFSSSNSSQINEIWREYLFRYGFIWWMGVTLTWVLRKFDITANEE